MHLLLILFPYACVIKIDEGWPNGPNLTHLNVGRVCLPSDQVFYMIDWSCGADRILSRPRIGIPAIRPRGRELGSK